MGDTVSTSSSPTMRCARCGKDGLRTIYYVDGQQLCTECAAERAVTEEQDIKTSLEFLEQAVDHMQRKIEDMQLEIEDLQREVRMLQSISWSITHGF
ncbi:MAG: hypothetical protein ABFC80_03820 [Coriobacteriales bacterium]